MYASPDAVPRYVAFSGLPEASDFILKESLQTARIMGLDESMQDAIAFKFLAAPLGEDALKELIQIPPGL